MSSLPPNTRVLDQHMYADLLGLKPGAAVSVAKLDNVNQPPHYARWPMQPIEFIAINIGEGPIVANVIKYVMRYDAKDGIKDLYKARSYLDMLIRKVEGHQRWWEKPVAEERKLNGR